MTADSRQLLEVLNRDLAELKRLLDAGCDVDVVHPVSGNTPLYNACFCDRADVVRLFLSRGADANKQITYRSPVDGRVEEGVVALMLAQSSDVVAALLDAGANPNARDNAGRTPLMRTVLAATPEAIELLLRAGADTTARDQDGHTAADIVRKRLAWLQDNWAALKQPTASARRRTLKTILKKIQGAGTPQQGGR